MGLYSDVIFPRYFDLVVGHKFYDLNREGILAKAEGKILEIGIGTGLNLECYPETVTHITAIDPNPGMEKELRAKLKSSRVQVDFHRAVAEKLPFDDQTFDTVVSTLTMCSIPNLPVALKEIRRVLKPTGKFIFLEHGLSREKWTAAVQKALNPIQKVVGCGCSLTVDVEKVFRESDFRVQQIRRRYVKHSPKFIGYIYEGVATP